MSPYFYTCYSDASWRDGVAGYGGVIIRDIRTTSGSLGKNHREYHGRFDSRSSLEAELLAIAHILKHVPDKVCGVLFCDIQAINQFLDRTMRYGHSNRTTVEAVNAELDRTGITISYVAPSRRAKYHATCHNLANQARKGTFGQTVTHQINRRLLRKEHGLRGPLRRNA